MDSRLLTLLETVPDGVDVNELASLLGNGVSAEDARGALNTLLAEHRVELVKFGDDVVRVKAKAAEPAGLTKEEGVLNSLIADAGNRGIWIRSLRDLSGLPQVQILKALKSLGQKKLIKTVKSVGTTKKCYMPYDAVEDATFTGGTFYSDRQLDQELVQTLTSVCIGMLTQKRKQAVERNPGDSLLQKSASYATPSEVANFIRDRKILHVPVTDEDIGRILEIAILDGQLERRSDGSAVRVRDAPPRASPLVTIPCALCPLANECAPGKEIEPAGCRYFDEWLQAIQ